MLERARGFLIAPWFIFSVALGLRVGNVILHGLYRIPPDFDHLYFGMEMGRVARSLVDGHGFGSVFAPDSGPTAWLGPVYPLMLAAVFKAFGTYTNASALVILALNSLFSASTCLTIYRIGEETLGRTTAVVAAWIWAALPYAIYWPTHHVWETSLSAFLLTAAFSCTLRLERSSGVALWLIYGALWGLIALTNAALLSFLIVSVGWLYARKRANLRVLLKRVVLSAAVAALIVSPWIVRNYRTFGRFVFPRSDFGAELYLENHEGGSREIVRYHPLWNAEERERYRQLGEMGYVRERGQIANEFIRSHPLLFLKQSALRAVYFWVTTPEEARILPKLRPLVRQVLFAIITLLCFSGLGIALRRRIFGVWLYLGLMTLFPLVYYFTHTESRYYHPLSPFVLTLAVYAVTSKMKHFSGPTTLEPKRPRD
jgi:4-amino-4-deoxy-L-arabinose transferase-like glycosyltransferase